MWVDWVFPLCLFLLFFPFIFSLHFFLSHECFSVHKSCRHSVNVFCSSTLWNLGSCVCLQILYRVKRIRTFIYLFSSQFLVSDTVWLYTCIYIICMFTHARVCTLDVCKEVSGGLFLFLFQIHNQNCGSASHQFMTELSSCVIPTLRLAIRSNCSPDLRVVSFSLVPL